MTLISKPGSGPNAVEVFKEQPRTLCDAGQPAEWVTHGEELARRKRETEATRIEVEEKEKRRVEQAEQSAKEREIEERQAAEKRTKRLAEQIRRDAERVTRRVQTAQKKRTRESAVEGKRRIAATNKSAALLGKAVALSVRSGKRAGVQKAAGKARTPIRSYQFAAFIVLEALALAVEPLEGEDVVPKLAAESPLAMGEHPTNSFESSSQLQSYWLDLKLKKKTLL
ncbi:GLE1 family protein [Gracilaria domingensis]|nr:GLE1 family protein [Gracilaria domingensis]